MLNLSERHQELLLRNEYLVAENRILLVKV